MKQLAPNVYTFSGLLAGRVYALIDGDEVTLIDAGIPPAASRILAQLRKAGYPPSAVKRILITHAHPDHVGGLPALHAACGAEIIASATEKPVIEGAIPPALPPREALSGMPRLVHMPSSTLPPAPVTRTVADGDLLPEVLGGLHVVGTPGHAPGHLSFWQPERGILFTGDVVFNLPRLRLPYTFLTVDMPENRRSVTKIAALDPTLLCFGHGVPIGERAGERLRAFAQKVALS